MRHLLKCHWNQDKALNTQKEIKGIQIAKEVKLSLFSDDMIVYKSDPKNSTRELLQLINTFCNVTGYKINSKKISVALLYINDKETEREIREASTFTIATQHKISWGNTNERSDRPILQEM